MAAPKKYSDELRERATRMTVELRRDPATSSGAIRRVAEQLGMHPETLRGWVRQAEHPFGRVRGATCPSRPHLAPPVRGSRRHPASSALAERALG
jgi:transposase